MCTKENKMLLNIKQEFGMQSKLLHQSIITEKYMEKFHLYITAEIANVIIDLH